MNERPFAENGDLEKMLSAVSLINIRIYILYDQGVPLARVTFNCQTIKLLNIFRF